MATQPGSEPKRCAITGQLHSERELTPLGAVRPPVAALIREEFPQFDDRILLSRDALTRFRAAYVERLLEKEKGDLSHLEEEVVQSLTRHEVISEDLDADEHREKLSLGDHLSDRLASFGGSWSFLILFGVILAVWMGMNSLVRSPFDPYPFILLNLLLSCLAAIQAPVIMMSQNRQETKDRLRARQDYRVNLKAELEIRHLHEKMDHLLRTQWHRLAEIQQVQLELLEELGRRE